MSFESQRSFFGPCNLDTVRMPVMLWFSNNATELNVSLPECSFLPQFPALWRSCMQRWVTLKPQARHKDSFLSAQYPFLLLYISSSIKQLSREASDGFSCNFAQREKRMRIIHHEAWEVLQNVLQNTLAEYWWCDDAISWHITVAECFFLSDQDVAESFIHKRCWRHETAWKSPDVSHSYNEKIVVLHHTLDEW